MCQRGMRKSGFDGVWGIEQEIKFAENVCKEGHKFTVYFVLFLTELTILIKSVSNAINLLLMAEVALKCVNLNSAHKFHHLRWQWKSERE
jgi:hypothetical protein